MYQFKVDDLITFKTNKDCVYKILKVFSYDVYETICLKGDGGANEVGYVSHFHELSDNAILADDYIINSKLEYICSK
jgi:hypothetical protein